MRLPIRKGQALVEFALVSLLAITAACGVIGIGIMVLHAGITNNVSGSCRDLLFEKVTSSAGLTNTQVYQKLRDDNLYNEAHLLLSKEDFDNRTYLGNPLAQINKLMLPLYQFDRDVQKYRYPGAITVGPNGDSILIPQLQVSGGLPSISAWYKPVEINMTDTASPPTYFELTINFPSQSATMHMSAYPVDENGESTFAWIEANDVNPNAPLPDGYSFNPAAIAIDESLSLNRGAFGLGSSPTYAVQVLPFRKVFYSTVIVRLKQPATSLP